MSSTDEASRSATCLNLDKCAKARRRVSIAWYPGAGEYCPDCGEALTLTYFVAPIRIAPIALPPASDRDGALAQRPGQVGSPPAQTTTARRAPRRIRAKLAIETINARRAPEPIVAPVPPNGSMRRVFALRSDAQRLRRSPAARPIVMFFAVVISAMGLVMFRPRIVATGVPRTASPGAAITVSYRASGLGSADYTLLGPDGQTLVHEPLPLGSGTIALTMPHASGSQTYLLRFHTGNGLASATADHYIRVPVGRVLRPAPVAHAATHEIEPPQIRSLALDRPTLASGDTLGVYYDVSASSGTIALFDPALQVTYEQADLAPSGRTTFTIPAVSGSRLLTVVLTARNGAVTTQSRVGVNVTATPAPSSPAASGAPAGASGGPVATAISAPPRVHARAPIHVEVRGAATDLQLVLLDNAGNEFARHDVRVGQRGADFTAPDVAVTTRFTFEATFPDGAGSQTLVREIAVTPEGKR